MLYQIQENGLYLVFEMEKEQPVYLLHMGLDPMAAKPELSWKDGCSIQEIQVTGENRAYHVGVSIIGTIPGNRMYYTGHTDERNEKGRILKIHTKGEKTGLSGTMSYQFYDGLSIIRCRNLLKNEGTTELGLELASTFVWPGAADPAKDKIRLLIPHNTWTEEVQWEENEISRLGGRIFTSDGTNKRIQVRSTGSWSTGEYLPMACMRNVTKETMQFWQIEHNGPWDWELQGNKGKLSLILTGPNEMEHHWWKCLKPGETFETVPAAAGIVKGGIDETFAVLTKYRRTIRRDNADNRKLPVIFNDYMNCLWADPTTEKELPMIDAAAAAGCEYYCIDAGWYTDDNWWPNVGKWEPSERRFPNGLKEVTDAIRSKGMIPGIWLEIEFMGIRCPMAEKVDPSWFFQRHGKVVIDKDRYQLDFRNPQVRSYTRGVVDRLIKEYGIGYFKIDYNTNAFMGTGYNSDSFGDGLLEHNRAYLKWLDEIFTDYPELVIENCSSGGMRMDYAMLERHSIQSTSDQTNYLKYASIAANAPTAVTPEQAAIWSYPLKDSSKEQIIFNCVNSCLMRIHQSGNMEVLTEENRNTVKEALEFYKKIRGKIPEALPFWPLGLAKDGDDWMALGLDFGERKLIAVWRIKGTECCDLPIPACKDKELSVKTAFPKEDRKCRTIWNSQAGVISVYLPEMGTARILEVNNRK